MTKVYMKGDELQRQIQHTEVPTNAVALWNLGQASVLVKGATKTGTAIDEADVATTLVVDPYLTRSIEVNRPDTEFVREYDAPLEPEQLAGITAVLITHHHGDHLDLDTITRLHRVSPNTKFIVPAPHVRMLYDAGVTETAVIAACAGEKIRVCDDATVLPVAAAHTDYETDAEGHHLYLGYVVNLGGVCIYHSGDTVVTDELVDSLSHERPDVAILPINGEDYARTKREIAGNMGMREAVDFALSMHADLLLPNHYDMFPNNRENPAFLVDYIFHQHRNLKFHMSAVGERFIYMRWI